MSVFSTAATYDFYPRPPRGGRRVIYLDRPRFIVFLSTPSARRATSTLKLSRLAKPFLSTPSARRATSGRSRDFRPQNISIHALREEGDGWSCSITLDESDFYPRPPRGGRHNNSYGVRPALMISIHALREEGDQTRQT